MFYGQMIFLRKGPSQKVQGTIWSWSCIIFPTPTYLNTHCAASPQFPGKLGMIFGVNQGYQIHVENLETFYVLVCCKYALFLFKISFLISTGVKDHTRFIFTFCIYIISLPNHPCIAFVHIVNIFPSSLSGYPVPTMQGGKVKLKLGISEI